MPVNKVRLVCKQCGNIFYRSKEVIKHGRGVYCSRKCMYTHRATIPVICDFCGKTFERTKSQVKETNFCSRECQYKHKEKKEYRECSYCGSPFIVVPSDSKHYCSLTCYGKDCSGEKSHLWKGGTYAKGRANGAYFRWRKAVFERDKHTCVRCGSDQKLQAHHIDSYTEFPEKAYLIENGETLCYDCHMKEHGKTVIKEYCYAH